MAKPIVKFVRTLTPPIIGRRVWVELAEDHHNENQLKAGETVFTSPVEAVEGVNFETRNTQYVQVQ